MCLTEGEAAAPAVRVLIAGIGGGGCCVAAQMQRRASEHLDFVALDTDYVSLQGPELEANILLGEKVTRRTGTGGDLRMGLKAAEESSASWQAMVKNYDMVFIVACLGGGTGSGAAPHFAKLAKQAKALTVAVVSTPCEYEGRRKAENASAGIAELRQTADSVIVVSNQKLLAMNDQMTYYDALKRREDVLTDIMMSLTNLVFLPATMMRIDFGAVKSVIQDGGTMVVAHVSASNGNSNVDDLAKRLLSETLVDHPPMSRAKALLLVTTLGRKIKVRDGMLVQSKITAMVNPGAEITCGLRLDETEDDKISATLIATHFEEAVQPVGAHMKFRKLYTIDEVNNADRSHDIYTPAYLRLEQASENAG